MKLAPGSYITGSKAGSSCSVTVACQISSGSRVTEFTRS